MSGQGDKAISVSDVLDGFYKAAKSAKEQMDDNRNVDDEEEEEEGEDIFEVDHIMDMKMIKGVRHFYVRWKGYDESEDSWEPEENVAGAKEIVEKFMASYKPRGKLGRPSKSNATPKSAGRKRKSHSQELSNDDEPEEKSESEDDEYGKSKRKRKKGSEPTSTSRNSQPKTESFTPVSALNMAIKRKMNSNLRWLEDDSDGNTSDNETKLPLLTPMVQPTKPSEDQHPIPPDVSLGESSTEKTKEKKKKKKSKKHSKDRERSGSPLETSRCSHNLPSSSEPPKVTVVGVYRPDDTSKNEFRFVVKDNSTNQSTIMTLAEAFLADGWQLCRYLASRIHFRANGEYCVEINGEAKL